MLDIKLIRERPDFVRARLAARGQGDDAKVGEVLQLDEQRRKLLTDVEALKGQRNRASKEIGALMAQKKIEEAEARKKTTREIGDRINAMDKEAVRVDEARERIMLQIPNLPHENRAGGKKAPRIIRWCAFLGEQPKFDFKPKIPHRDLRETWPCRF